MIQILFAVSFLETSDSPVTIGLDVRVPIDLYGKGPEPGFLRNFDAGFGEPGMPSLLAAFTRLDFSE